MIKEVQNRNKLPKEEFLYELAPSCYECMISDKNLNQHLPRNEDCEQTMICEACYKSQNHISDRSISLFALRMKPLCPKCSTLIENPKVNYGLLRLIYVTKNEKIDQEMRAKETRKEVDKIRLYFLKRKQQILQEKEREIREMRKERELENELYEDKYRKVMKTMVGVSKQLVETLRGAWAENPECIGKGLTLQVKGRKMNKMSD